MMLSLSFLLLIRLLAIVQKLTFVICPVAFQESSVDAFSLSSSFISNQIGKSMGPTDGVIPRYFIGVIGGILDRANNTYYGGDSGGVAMTDEPKLLEHVEGHA